MTLHRHFFALQPDARASDQIDRVAAELRPVGRPTPRSRRHVSLHSLGLEAAVLDERTARAIRAAGSVERRPFRVAFNRVTAFGRGEGRRALVLRGDEGVLGVELLQQAVQAALAGAGLVARHTRPFEPHLTVARGCDATDEAFIAPVGWTVREFVLIHSFVGEGRYEIAGRFPLGD